MFRDIRDTLRKKQRQALATLDKELGINGEV